MSVIQGLYNAQRGMNISQAGLSIVSNNIANMNTEGYSKQRLDAATLVMKNAGVTTESRVKEGMGAYIESVTRNRDFYMDLSYRNDMSAYSYYENLAKMASMVETLSADMGSTGLTGAMNEFYSAAQTLSLRPTDSVARINYAQQAKNVADYMNKTAESLNEYRKSLVGDVNEIGSLEESKISAVVGEVNDLLSQITKLNKEITMNSIGEGSPNGLLDERDLLLDKLSEYIPIHTKELQNNGIEISVGNYVLVRNMEQNASFNVEVGDADNPAIVSLVNENGDQFAKDVSKIMDTGYIKSILEVGGSASGSDVSIKKALDELDLIANNFAQQINDIQLKTEAGPPPMTSACIDNSVNPAVLKKATQNIFVDDTNTTTNITAANIKVNEEILNNPYEIATAYVEAVDDVDFAVKNINETGNNKSALSFAESRNQTITGLNGKSVEKYLESMIEDLGVAVKATETNYETQSKILEQASTSRASLTGVSLDEELVDLVKYQRSYEASAKIFNTTNEILELLMTLGS